MKNHTSDRSNVPFRGSRPPPPDWIHQPAKCGLDSVARHYRGYQSDRHIRLLRPATAIKLELADGDLISLTNQDGATSVLLMTFNTRGESDFGAIGLSRNPVVECAADGHGFDTVARWILQHGGDVNRSRPSLPAVRIFDASTPVGENFTLRVISKTTLWMLVDPREVFSSERIFNGGMGGALAFEHIRHGVPATSLPDPLGDVREEFTIPRGTARAYAVHAGETVQIIDVEGQQCSDFMAMNAHSLDGGVERYIDSTATRSMVRGAYPIPGLFDKFFDQDMRPLLKLKQDTVGRHDTFALACTARGYEERGFFGHLNCSDNISYAYEPYGITPRAA